MVSLCYAVSNGSEHGFCVQGWSVGIVVGIELILWTGLIYVAWWGVRKRKREGSRRWP